MTCSLQKRVGKFILPEKGCLNINEEELLYRLSLGLPALLLSPCRPQEQGPARRCSFQGFQAGRSICPASPQKPPGRAEDIRTGGIHRSRRSSVRDSAALSKGLMR